MKPNAIAPISNFSKKLEIANPISQCHSGIDAGFIPAIANEPYLKDRSPKDRAILACLFPNNRSPDRFTLTELSVISGIMDCFDSMNK
jgi:hypothetical protein